MLEENLKLKKYVIVILAVFLLVGCCACGKEPVNPAGSEIQAVFPANSRFCGMTLDGMTASEAKAAVEEAVTAYTLTVQIGEDEITYNAEDLNLTAVDADYAALLESVIQGEAVEPELITYDLSDAEQNLQRMNKTRTKSENAYLSYDADAKKFVLNEEVIGTIFSEEQVLVAMDTAVQEMTTSVTILGKDLFLAPEVTADSKKAKDALKTANTMLDVTLTYTYGATSNTETIDRDMIASWLIINEDGLLVEVVPAELSAYVAEMEEAHSTSSGTAKFVTTGGSEITINVAAAGQTVDTDALYNDIADCIMNGISGEREAPYVKTDTDAASNFGGNYVEIDLTSQHLWVYSGGDCVVSTDIVSGCVSKGHATPTGVYTIKSRETNRYLVGDGYKSWVNYWMPFNGGIGLHDADGWRSAYGGSIYQYSGSHGCINMPKSAAAETYKHISVGTYVIVYGGLTSVDGQQSTDNTKPENTPKDPCESGHSWNGGKATSNATCTKEGVMTYTCTVCGKTKTETIQTTAHSYADGVCTVCGAADPNYTPPEVTPEPEPTPNPGTDDGGGTTAPEPGTGDTGSSTEPTPAPDDGGGTTAPEPGTGDTGSTEPTPTPDDGATAPPPSDTAENAG